jgi:hypothetical protein
MEGYAGNPIATNAVDMHGRRVYSRRCCRRKRWSWTLGQTYLAPHMYIHSRLGIIECMYMWGAGYVCPRVHDHRFRRPHRHQYTHLPCISTALVAMGLTPFPRELIPHKMVVTAVATYQICCGTRRGSTATYSIAEEKVKCVSVR